MTTETKKPVTAPTWDKKEKDAIADYGCELLLENTDQEQLKKTLGEKLSLNFIVDKKIIGGLVVKVGSKMVDTSLANKINKLKIAMKGA